MTLPWAHGMTIRERLRALLRSAGAFGSNNYLQVLNMSSEYLFLSWSCRPYRTTRPSLSCYLYGTGTALDEGPMCLLRASKATPSRG